MARHTFVARHDDIAVEVGFRLNIVAAHRILLLHREFGRNFLFQGRHFLRQLFQDVLDVAVQHLFIGFRNVVTIFLADGNQVLVENGDCHLGLGLLLNKSDDACALAGCLEVVGVEIIVIAYSLTC